MSLSLLVGGALVIRDWQSGNETRGPRPEVSRSPENHSKAKVPQVSARLEKAMKEQVLRVGVKEDQPGLSEQQANGEWTGFDIEYAVKIVRGLGFTGTIKFVPLGTEVRESEVELGNVLLTVGSYSITTKRKRLVRFAGPYFVTQQALLMHTGEPGKVAFRENGGRTYAEVNSVADLRPGTVFCTASSSTSAERLESSYPDKNFTVIEKADYQQCVDDLLDDGGRTEVVSTDRAVLAGFLSTDDRLKMIRDSLKDSTESWGIGMHLDDPELQRRVCDVVEKIRTDGWQDLYDRHLKVPMDDKSNRSPEPTECATVTATPAIAAATTATSAGG
ncbi:transporter substrate-binding domain-containing protein [Streptomyces sp. NBC_00690]|uniref:transporter substrate-binding domain-containing protein n=1 Tax=Streptomyces sp. NBC_00690 TaxID=2975808 RepID=UPI002E28C6D6|nr:transporter substrate-binding domain-containing protein [Streptomyces sp. NBC_00690]